MLAEAKIPGGAWPLVHSRRKTGVIYRPLRDSSTLSRRHHPRSQEASEAGNEILPRKQITEATLASLRSPQPFSRPLLIVGPYVMQRNQHPYAIAGSHHSSNGESPLSLTPATIDFGTVQTNSKTVTSIVNLTNMGKYTETIESASIFPAFSSRSRNRLVLFTLKPGQTIQLRTTFTPKSAGNDSGKLNSQWWVQAPFGSAEACRSWQKPEILGQVEIPVIGVVSVKNTDPPPVVGVSVSPSSVVVQAGHSKQFTSTVTGTSNTAVTWTAQLGSIRSSGVYMAPTLTDHAVDTVSAVSVADSTKYASASVTVTANSGLVNTFYIDPANGNDSNNGTSSTTAWKTLCRANSAATLGPAGTIITMLPRYLHFGQSRVLLVLRRRGTCTDAQRHSHAARRMARAKSSPK